MKWISVNDRLPEELFGKNGISYLYSEEGCSWKRICAKFIVGRFKPPKADKVTEEMLRANDGYIHLDKGCSIVRTDEYNNLKSDNAELREKIIKFCDDYTLASIAPNSNVGRFVTDLKKFLKNSEVPNE